MLGRIINLVLALAVGGGALWQIRHDPPEALQTLNPSPPDGVGALQDALRGNLISPYRWLELAEGYEQSGEIPKSDIAFRRAEQLGPHLPEVWIRTAAYYFRRGETDRALEAGAQAESVSAQGDAILFQYFDHFAGDIAAAMKALDGNQRAQTAYFRHLMAGNQPDRATAAWDQLRRRGVSNRAAAIEYVDFLVKARRLAAAEGAWTGVNPAEPAAYPRANRIYNGGFEQDLSGCMLDWKITPAEAVDILPKSPIAKEGKFSLAANFHGTENLHFENVFQSVIVAPGTYRISAWIKTDDITTDEGVRLCVSDAEIPDRFRVQTEALRGTNDWTTVSNTLVIPAATHLLKVSICRLPSSRFDNKISGTAWVDAVSLVRER